MLFSGVATRFLSSLGGSAVSLLVSCQSWVVLFFMPLLLWSLFLLSLSSKLLFCHFVVCPLCSAVAVVLLVLVIWFNCPCLAFLQWFLGLYAITVAHGVLVFALL